MPRDALHHGGVEHRELHNSYGYYFHMATSDGLLKRGDGKDRPLFWQGLSLPEVKDMEQFGLEIIQQNGST